MALQKFGVMGHNKRIKTNQRHCPSLRGTVLLDSFNLFAIAITRNIG